MSNRPRYSDEGITLAIARKFIPRLTQWTEGCGTPEELQKEMADTLQRAAPRFDPYEMAQYLEKRYLWSSDAELVDLLYDVSVEAYEVLAEAVAKWVKANGIVPRKALGSTVEVPPQQGDTPNCSLIGQVIGIDAEHATYKVFVPARGHVRMGFGIQGAILPFEAFHELATPPEEFVLSPQ